MSNRLAYATSDTEWHTAICKQEHQPCSYFCPFSLLPWTGSYNSQYNSCCFYVFFVVVLFGVFLCFIFTLCVTSVFASECCLVSYSTVLIFPLADSSAPWDARPAASPSLSEVVSPPPDSLNNQSPSSHVNPLLDPPHISPMEIAATPESCLEGLRGQGPESHSAGRRSGQAGGRNRPREGGSRSSRHGSGGKGHQQQHLDDIRGASWDAKPAKSSRMRSKERSSSNQTRKRDIPKSPKPSRVETGMNGGNSSSLDGKAQPKDPEKGTGETPSNQISKTTSTTTSNSSSMAGRKATVSPGPWKIPGSDKLPSSLRSATSTISR